MTAFNPTVAGVREIPGIDRPAPDWQDPRRVGRSGLVLPPLSFGLWHTFGNAGEPDLQRELLLAAFDAGVWHFDTADRYGPPIGHAERVLGRVLARDLSAHRDDLVVATKVGGWVRTSPYGSGGSRKHVTQAIEASLRRLDLEYVDILYSHVADPDVPLEETVGALAAAVTGGKALYIGISNHDAEQTREAATLLRAAGVPLVIHQHAYSLLRREAETELHPVLREEGAGAIAYSPLAQGLLTSRYLRGVVPAGARAGASPFLDAGFLTDDYLARARALDDVARADGRTLAQLALAWVLRDPLTASAIVGASSVAQLQDNLQVLGQPALGADVAAAVERIVAD